MTDEKITQLTTTTTPQNTDLIPIVQNVSTTPVTNAITYSNLMASYTPTTGLVRPNLLINGNFVIDQRNKNNINTPGAVIGWIADHWKAYRGGTVAGYTVQDFVNNALDGRSNYVLMTRSSGDTSLQPLIISQDLESNDSKILQGQYLTLTVANYFGTGASGTFSIQLLGGTGNDQSASGTITGVTTLASYTGSVTNGVQEVHTITTSAPVAHTVTQIFAKIIYTPTTSTAVANDYMLIYGVKLEVGQTFAGWNFPSYQETLAKCQRYCFARKFASGYGYILGAGFSISTTQAKVIVQYPVTMRVTPTVSVSGTVSNLQINLYINTGSYPLNTAPTHGSSDNVTAELVLTTGTAMPGSNYPCNMRGGGDAILIFDAEL